MAFASDHCRMMGLVAAGLLLTGCAGAPSSTALTATLTAPPGQVIAATTTLPIGTSPSVQGTAIAVYERVARRALVCWFGANGPLKKTHIFNADVTSPAAGGTAEAYIHDRDLNPSPGQLPRGAKVFRVKLEREAEERTRVVMEVGKLPADLGEAMQKDIVAWAMDKDSCEAQIVRPPPPPPADPNKSKVKKRTKQAAR